MRQTGENMEQIILPGDRQAGDEELKARESELWATWTATGDTAARDDLVRLYLPLVEYLANQLGRFVPSSYRPDLYGFGVIGLMDAVDKFKPELGYAFRTYGALRIRGAMSDGIRKLNWLPRGAGQRASRIIEKIIPIDFQTATTPIGVRLQDTLHDPNQASTTEGLELTADHEEVVEAIASLPDRERRVIVEYYFDRRKLADIGADLGVTESRACQIHRAALVLLRDILVQQRQTA